MARFSIIMSANDNGVPTIKSFDFYTNCQLHEDAFVRDFKEFNPTFTDILVLSYVETSVPATA